MYNPEEIHEADDAKPKTDGNLPPNHPDVCAAQHGKFTPAVCTRCLLDGRPCRQPANSQREAPCDRCNDQVIPCHRLGNVGVGTKSDQCATKSRELFVVERSG